MIPYLPLKEITERYQPELQKRLAKVVESGMYLLGEETRLFEEEYASYIGTRYCITCGNGYDALWLIFAAYKAMGAIEEGDEVIVPANTFIASVLAITGNGLKPVFAEPDAATSVIGSKEIERLITPKCKAVMLVHLYGRNCYSDEVAGICRSRGIKIVEDNAQAHGCMYNVKRTGSLGDAAAHSFYPGKNLGALGDGGAVTTDDNVLKETIATLHNYGSSKKYIHEKAGINSRLDEIQAAALRVKLPHLDNDNDIRRSIAKRYFEGIDNRFITLQPTDDDMAHVFHIFPVFCKERERLVQHLNERGIATLVHYPIPVHKQKCYSEYNALSLPVAERLANEEVSLPCHPAMNERETKEIIDAINCFRI